MTTIRERLRDFWGWVRFAWALLILAVAILLDEGNNA